MLQLIEPTKAVIVDSTPLVDLYDMEARWGHTGSAIYLGNPLGSTDLCDVLYFGWKMLLCISKSSNDLGITFRGFVALLY
jgi:hypothetical protein